MKKTLPSTFVMGSAKLSLYEQYTKSKITRNGGVSAERTLSPIRNKIVTMREQQAKSQDRRRSRITDLNGDPRLESIQNRN